MNRLEEIHKKAAQLNKESTPLEIFELLTELKKYWVPDDRVLAPGTIGWILNVFLIEWFDYQFEINEKYNPKI